MAEPVEKLISNWELVYYISTYILAVIAILGFYYSQKSSVKVSESLMIIQRGLSSLTEPLIKFTDYNWVIGNDDGPISLKNPPLGIIFSLKNVSHVAVHVVESKFEIFYGDKLLDDPVPNLGAETRNPYILAPNEDVQNGAKKSEAFIKYLSTSKEISTPPHLNLKCKVKFETMNGEKYEYFIHREIYFCISMPNQKSSRTLKETLIKVTHEN